MSIILRMNDLPLSANSLDIRRFFRGIRIPDGGVHIIGGPESSVFIAFNDDSAAAEAMKMNGQLLLNYPVRIGLSSRNEMKNLIKTLFECAIMQENSAPIEDVIKQDKQASPERSFSPPNSVGSSIPPSRYPLQSQAPSGPPMPLLPLHSSQSANIFHPGPPGFENFDQPPKPQVPGQFGDNHFGSHPPPMPPFDWNEAGPSSSAPHRPNNSKSVPAPLLTGPLPPPLPSSSNDSSRRLTAEVFGLPYGAGIQDIMDFFYPLCTEDNIQLVEDEHNFPTGVALVRFMNMADLNRALSLSGGFMRDSPVYVKALHEPPPANRPGFPPNPQQLPFGPSLHPGPPPPQLIGKGPLGPGPFYGPPDCRYDVPYDAGYNPPPGSMGPPIVKPVVYMKGLPFERCTPHHITDFFNGLRIVDIKLENDKRGRLAGNAYVEFATMEDYDEACRNFHMRHMGSRYIEVLPVNTERVRSYCIHMKNIPNCTFAEVGDFLSSFNFVPARIHHNVKSKEAYVEFLSAKEQLKAVDTLNGEFWDGCNLSVSRIPFQVMMKKINEVKSLSPDELSRHQGPSGHRAPSYRDRSPPNGPKRKRIKGRSNPRRKPGYGSGYNPFEDKKCVLIALDCDQRAQVADICELFENYGIEPNMVDIRDNNNGTVDIHIAFHNHFDAKDALENMNRENFFEKPLHLRPA